MMTKAEALQAIEAGLRVTHTLLMHEGWMQMGSKYDYQFKDGTECSKGTFWRYKTNETWLTGWSIVNDDASLI
ncbi:hypothetical protein AB4254_11770 [Vibrio breoganii]